MSDVILQALIKGLAAQYPHIPICMHQDHGNSEATRMTAIQYGFTSVMMDGSQQTADPASYDYNLEITSTVTQMAHHGGVSVEGELGVLGSLKLAQAIGRAAVRQAHYRRPIANRPIRQ